MTAICVEGGRHSHRAMRSGLAKAHGQALVETAFLLPVIIMIMGLAVFVAQATMSGVDAVTAARAGAIAASYQDWKAATVLVQAQQAAKWACNEESGNGTTCSSSCTTSGPYSATTPGCTFSGTSPLSSLTVTDVTDASTGFKFVIVKLTYSVHPIVDVFSVGTLTLTTETRAMAEQ